MEEPSLSSLLSSPTPITTSTLPTQHGADRPHTTLLALPRELRDLIYSLLLNTHIPPPVDPDHAGDRTRHPAKGPEAIFYPAASPRPALLQLKLCCHQLHDEVEGAIATSLCKAADAVPVGALGGDGSGAGGQGPTAHLDLMIRGDSMWPTWTDLPLTATLSPVVRIQMRIFDALDSLSMVIFRSLFALIRRLISHGVCFMHGTKELETPLMLAKLQMDAHVMFCPVTETEGLMFGHKIMMLVERLANSHVGMGRIEVVEMMYRTRKAAAWRLETWPTGASFAKKVF